MAFLRMDKRRVAVAKSEKRRKSLSEERDQFLAQRQAEARNPQARMLGKTFATKRKAAEYGKRLLEGGFVDGKPREARSMRASGKASMAVKRDTVGAASGVVRVRPVNGVWRRYVEAADGADGPSWRWVSDHASMNDALQAVRPLNDPE